MSENRQLEEALMCLLKNENTVRSVCKVLADIEKKNKDEKKNRQQEGIQKAKEKGVCFGRPKIKEPDNFPLIYEQFLNREITAVSAAKLCNMALSTFYRKGRKYEDEAAGVKIAAGRDKWRRADHD